MTTDPTDTPPEPVSAMPRAAYDAVFNIFRRFHDADEIEHVAVSLYVLMTYVYEVFDALPYLHVVGDPGTGKTRMAELLEMLSFKARLSAGMSPAAVYRFVQNVRGTLIVDEFGRTTADLRRVLNAGYKCTGCVTRVATGGKIEEIQCFGPKVLVGNDPETNAALSSRMLTLVSQATTRELDRFFVRRVTSETEIVRETCETFGKTYRQAIETTYQNLESSRFPSLVGREFELAAPLVAVAMVLDVGQTRPLTPIIVGFLKTLAEKKRNIVSSNQETTILWRLVTEFIGNRAPDAKRIADLYLAA